LLDAYAKLQLYGKNREGPLMARVTQLIAAAPVRTIAGEVDAFLDDAQDRRGLSANTLTAYRSDLLTAAAVLTAPLDAISLADVEAFVFCRQEAKATKNRRIASLRQFFRWAQRMGYRRDNPVDLVEPIRKDEKLPRPIKYSDLGALSRAIAAAPQPYRLIFTILRETGMRAEEVLGLNVGDIMLERGREGLLVREAKNNHQRVVVLSSDVMPKTLSGLRVWLRALGQDAVGTLPLFCSNRGTRVAYDTLHYQWVQLCKAANLVDVVDGEARHRYTIHQLRHTIASELITLYPEHIVSRVLGHRDPRSTRRYAEVTENQVRAAFAARRR
jgi:integrase/recombinase XerD